jgi:CrcB protein
MPILLVAIGGALGAVARFLVATLFAQKLGHTWPWGTLFINVSGCVLIALFLGAGSGRIADSSLRYLLPVGFVGAYTTFSTFEFEVWSLVETGRPAGALAYLVASNVLGYGAVLLGVSLARR